MGQEDRPRCTEQFFGSPSMNFLSLISSDMSAKGCAYATNFGWLRIIRKAKGAIGASYSSNIGKRIRRCHQLWRLTIYLPFRDNENGGVAIEFAILALPFFVLIFGILGVVYHALVQSELDRAITSIASDVALHASDAKTSAAYLSQGACSDYIGPLLRCDRTKLGAGVVTGRMVSYKDIVFGRDVWNLGCAGDTVILELTYPYQELITPVAIADIIEQAGQKYYRARAVVRREPVITGSGAC